MSRKAPKETGPQVAELIEEAVHLLRRNPRELAWYYAGTGPFAVGLLYFWSYVTWFVPPDGEIAAGALLLALLFGWMKAWQHRFVLRLRARKLEEPALRWTRAQWLKEIFIQLRLHAAGIVVLPLAALFGVPFGWAYCYYQSATAIPQPPEGSTTTRSQSAFEQMQLWPAQNHWALAILTGLWLMVLLNIAVAFYTLPALASQWLGMKTIFAFNGWSYMNSTFVALVIVLTHLLVDPLIKTFYLLRVFHGGARRTGEDVRLVLAREKASLRRLASGSALLVLGVVLFLMPLTMRAAGDVATIRTAPVPVLDQALDRALERPDFRWRLHPRPVPPDQEKEGIIKGFVRSTFSLVKQMVKTIIGWVKSVYDWFSELFPGGSKGDDENPKATSGPQTSFDWMAALQLAAYLLLCAVAGLLIFVAWKVFRHNRLTQPFAAPAVIPAGTPDLRDENVEASRLPTEGWLDLARQQIAAGEWRLALRALFLATLARHAREGWLSLAKFKTNLDYESELRRRVHSRTGVIAEFREYRRRYEEVWYGSVPPDDGLARDWLKQMEGSK